MPSNKPLDPENTDNFLPQLLTYKLPPKNYLDSSIIHRVNPFQFLFNRLAYIKRVNKIADWFSGYSLIGSG